MRSLFFSALFGLALAATSPAQACANLAVRGSGAPGSTLTFVLRGATAQAPALLVIGPNTGSTHIRLGPLGGLTLALDRPFVFVPMGQTNAFGTVALPIGVPPKANKHSLHGQALTILGRRWRRIFCTSDVEGFSIG